MGRFLFSHAHDLRFFFFWLVWLVGCLYLTAGGACGVFTIELNWEVCRLYGGSASLECAKKKPEVLLSVVRDERAERGGGGGGSIPVDYDSGNIFYSIFLYYLLLDSVPRRQSPKCIAVTLGRLAP